MTDPAREAALEGLVAVAVRFAVAERLAPPTAEPALRAIADAAAAALHVAAASIALHEAAEDRLVFRAAAGPQGEGVIVNLGSISWHLGITDLALYQTAKAAVEGLTRALARELGPDGIRVSCVIPGNVRTPRQLKWYTPEGEAEIVAGQCLKGRLVPEDIAAMILFLASDDARLITGHGHFVDAGWR